MKPLLALLALLPTLASGQVPKDNPVVDAVLAIGARGLVKGAAPATSPTKFKPNGKRDFVATYAKGLFETIDERKALVDATTQLIENYETSVKGTAFANDASAAVAFSVSVLYAVGRSEEPSDEVFLALIERFQSALDTPKVREGSDAQKQEAYEWALCSTSVVLSVAAAVETEADQAKVRALAEVQLMALLGAKLDQFAVSGNDLTIRGSGSTQGATPAAGLAPGFTYQPPSDWVKDGPWLVYSTREGDHVTAAMVRFPPAIPAKGNMGDALRMLWKENVPAPLTDAAGGMVYRRYVGAKLFSQFIFGKGTEEGRKSDSVFTVFLIDCGSTWQPVVVAQTYRDVNANAAGEGFSAQYSYGTSADYAETMLSTFRCPGAPNQALATREALVGDYQHGGTNTLHWENIYTGATSMTFTASSGTLDLRADGTFAYTFTSANGQVGATVFRGAKGAGTYAIQGDILTCTYTSYDQGDAYKRTQEQYRIAGLAVFPGGEQVMVLFNDLKKPVNNVTVANSGTWYSTKK